MERAWLDFERIDALATDDAVVAAILQSPGVMAARILDRAFQGRPTHAAQVVAMLRTRFEKAPQTYPIGGGPIELLAIRVLQSELSIETARELATRVEICSQLSRPYVNALAGACSFRAQDGEFDLASCTGDLLVVAAEALYAADPDDDEGLIARWIAWLSRVDVVKMVIHQTADGRLLKATSAGALRLMAGRVPNEQLLGDLMYRLGTLYLDPWIVGRDQANYDRAIAEWRSLAEVSRLGDEGMPVPAAEAALRQSESSLRRAAGFVKGDLRGKVLKALVQLLNFRARVLRQDIDRPELVALACEALPLVDQSHDPEPRQFLNAVLMAEGAGGAFDDAAWEDRALRPSRRAELAVMAMTAATNRDPTRAVDIFLRCREVFTEAGDESLYVARWKCGVYAFDALYRAGAKHRYDVEAAHISRALAAAKDNSELTALTELDAVVRVRDVNEIDDLLRFVAMQLRIGAAANAAQRGESVPAVEEYVRALALALQQGLPQQVTSLLQGIRLAVSADPTVNAGLGALRITSSVLPELEQLLGERAQISAWDLARVVMAKLTTTRAAPDAHLMAHQLAKGVRFGAAAAAGSRLDTSRFATDLVAIRGEVKSDALSDEWVMAGYAHPNAQLSGDNPAICAANQRLRIDIAIRSAWGSEAALPEGHSTEDLQRLLPDNTALLSLYVGADSEGGLSLFSLGVTRESVVPSVTQTHFEGKLVILEDKQTGHRAIQSPSAMLVAAAREAIRESLGRIPLNADGVTSLAPIAGLLKGSLHFLEDCERSGKTRLLLVPHGALHFFPFHLLGDPSAPLAERWQISYLPSLLALSRPAVSLRERSLCVLGLDYLDPSLNPHDLPFLAAAREEAEECAHVFETVPHLDAAATPARLREGLATARFVHFSGHGALDVIAPTFQTLFLAPDAGSDGRVFSHELLAGSFAGCELVSLSACESGLGRFDLADNLMGIPAALLSGGVRHVIATLWEVREATARLFFRSLYQKLHRGATCSDAFELARRSTRTSFPAFRDWGAFVLMGHEGVEI